MVYGRFSELCKLAYSGISDTSYRLQLIFNDSDLPSGFDSMGFMDSVTELYVTQGTVSSHNFLHLTFQEFLAAVHISTMSPADQLEHFQRHRDGRYRVVLRFLAGLTELSCFSKDTIKKIFILKDTICSSEYSIDWGSSPYSSIAFDADVNIDLVNWIFEAQTNDVISLLEKNIVYVIIKNRSMLPLDYYSLGYCIAHSQCQWVLSFREYIGREKLGMLVDAASSRQETGGRVVGLRGKWNNDLELEEPLSMVAESVIMLFTQWKILGLHELHLDLDVPCHVVQWPDLSRLRVLHLGISYEINWRLDTLLPRVSLESLIISCTEGDGYLMLSDCFAVGEHIKSTVCLKKLYVGPYSNPILICSEGMEVISKALAENQSLPLERLELKCYGDFTDIATNCLVEFIKNTTTLQHLSIHYCTFCARGLLALAVALHHNSTLQVKDVYMWCLGVTVNGDDEAKDYAQLLVKYPYMVDNTGFMSCHPYLHGISDAGAIVLAQALHHDPPVNRLDLSGNNAIGKEGTHQLVQALTVNTCITEVASHMDRGGLTLPRKCEEYAKQYTPYNTVKDRIQFH